MTDLNVAIKIGATVQGSVTRAVGRSIGQIERIKRAEGQLAAISERRAARQSRLLGATVLGAAVLGPIAGVTRAAIRFESVMADVKKVVEFDTPEQFAEMSADILQLSERIPVAASGIGDIVAAAGQAGIAREELTRFAEDAAKVAVAFDISGAEAGGRLTGLRSIFKLNQDGVMRLAGAYNHLSNNMDATAPMMLNVAERAGSVAHEFGLTGQQTGALAATFLALKTPPEVAGTAINAMLVKLSTAPQQSKNFQAALDELGMSAEELKEDIEQDAQGALLNFLSAVDQAEDKQAILFSLFGQEYVDDITKLAGSMDLYRKSLGLAGDEAAALTSIEEEYAARAATTENQLQLLKNKANVLAVNLGNVLLPSVNDVVGSIGGLVSKAAALAREFPGATKVVIGLVGGLTALVVGGAFAGYAATFLAEGWVRGRLALLRAGQAVTWLGARLNGLSLRAIPKAILSLRLLRLALISTGIGAAVVAFGIAAAFIIRHWEPIAAFFSGFGEGVSEAFAPLAPVFDWLGSVFAWLTEKVGYTSEELEGFKSAGKSVGMIVGAVFNALTYPIRKVIAGVGWVLESLGLIGETNVQAGLDVMDEEPPARRRGPVGRAAVGAVVAASVAAPAVAAPAEPIPASPAPAVTTADAPAFPAPATTAADAPAFPAPATTAADALAFPAPATTAADALAFPAPAATTADAPEFADFGATPATEAGDEPAWERIEADLDRLAAAGETEAVPFAGEAPGFRAAQPGAVVQGASIVFHQTFNFENTGPEIDDEIARRMEIVMRRASVEAGLAENEDVF